MSDKTQNIRQLKIARLGIYYFFGFSSLLIILSLLKIPDFLPAHTFGFINILLLLYFIYHFLKRNLVNVTFVFCFVIMLLLTGLLNSNNFPYVIMKLSDSNFIFGSLAALFIFSLCDDSEKILKWSVQIGYFVIIVSTCYYLWLVTSDIDGMSYMSFAYGTITCWAFITYKALRDKQWYGILFSCVSAFFLAMYGSRGGVLCILVFILFYTLFSTESYIRKIAVTGLLFISGLLFFAFYQQILTTLIKVASFLGADSRNLYFLQNLNELNFSSRTDIWEKMIPIINQKPFLGNGIGADNYYLGGYYTKIHNGYLELILNFGYIFGGILLMLVILLGIYMLFFCKDKEWKMLFGIFYIISIPKLMISYSIYLNYELFASIAIFFCYLRSRKSEPAAYNVE